MIGPAPRERPQTGTVMIRDRRVWMASEGAAALLGRPLPALLGRPFVELFAPEDRARVAERCERRLRGDPVPSEYEAVAVQPDGERLTLELRVTREGADVVVQLRDVSDQAARRPRLDALAALGAAISREQRESDVIARVRAALPGLDLVPVLMRAEPEGVQVEWGDLPAGIQAAFEAQLGKPLAGFRGRWSAFSRAVWSEGVAFSDDWAAEVAAFMPEQYGEAARALLTANGLARAVAVRLDERRGVRFYLVLAGGWLRGEDVPAVRLFAAQIAAALDAAHTIAVLSRHNADLAAMNRIGELASGVSDLPTLFRRAEEVIQRAAGCEGIALYVLDDANGLLVPVYDSLAAEAQLWPVPLHSPLGGVIGERVARVVAAEDGPRLRGWLLACSAAAWVPLIARSKPVGVMAAGFQAGKEEVRSRLELLSGVAAHFASAIESHGLLADLRRRVAELTLLNDVALASAQLDPVLLLDSALRRVCATLGLEEGAAYLCDGDRLLLAASFGVTGENAHRYGHGEVGQRMVGLAVQRLAPVVAADAAAPGAAEPERDEIRPAVAVPLLANGRAVGAIGFGRRARRPLAEGEVPLLSALGAQLGVVVESARLFADVRRRLSDLEAVHALTQRIFENAPGDVQGLLVDGCRAAARALGCRGAAVFLAEEDGRMLLGGAPFGPPFEPASVRVERDGLAAEAIRTGAPACSADVTLDPRSAFCGRPEVPPASMVAVPLVSRAATRGVLFLSDVAGRAFTAPERALANALGGELAVGLENAELYAEARVRLSELSTVIDVARVVSSSLDLEEVLLAGAEHLKQTLAASGCTILLDDFRRQELRRAAFRGAPIGPPAVPLTERSLARDALEAHVPVSHQEAGAALLAVPLHVRGQPVGVALVTAEADRGFLPGDLSRAMAIASQLAVAVDNARLYQETRRRAEELGLLHDVGRSLVATLEIEQVLDAGVRSLARMVDVPVALLALAGADGTLEIRAVWGGSPQLLGRRLPLEGDPGGGGAAQERLQPIAVEDVLTDPRAWKDLVTGSGARAYLALPLLVRERYIGSAVMIDRHPRRFGPAEVDRATAIANQLAVAAENARLYEDLRKSYAALERAQRQLIQQERLAALGEISAVVAHEVRNPLGVIFNSLGSLRRLLRPEGDAKVLLDILGEEAEGLNRIVGDLLDFARPSTPVLRPEPLERVAEEAVAAALAQNSPPIEVRREVEPDLPPVPMDARLVRQAVLNLAVNAVQAMPRGGRLTLRLRRDGPGVALELEDSGPGIPDEVRSRIFEPFFTTKASGTGLGLAVVKRIIVESHGGEISVQSRPGEGTAFRIHFPLKRVEG